VTLRRETIEAVGRCPFIAEQFAMFERNTVQTAGASWTGTYLIGWRGYLELFAPGGADELVAGSSGLGFSAVRIGGGQAVKGGLRALDGEALSAELMTRLDGGESVPWFENIRLRSLDRPFFSAWLMDFRPEYLARRGIPLGEDGRFDRHAYNAASYRRSGRTGEFEGRLLDDLVEVRLDLGAGEADSLGRFLRTLGFEAAGEPPGRVFMSAGAVIRVRTGPAPGYRIRKVVCSLRKAVEPPVELVFGPDAKLRAEGLTAVWTFGDPATAPKTPRR